MMKSMETKMSEKQNLNLNLNEPVNALIQKIEKTEEVGRQLLVMMLSSQNDSFFEEKS